MTSGFSNHLFCSFPGEPPTMKYQSLFVLVTLLCAPQYAEAQETAPTTGPLLQPKPATEPSQEIFADKRNSGLHVGSPNAIKIGGGEGLRFGPPGIGVQYGGGQGVRYGTDRFGVKYGGCEGVRYGTPNIGVQYGGGQILRWGTPSAGVRIGGNEGVRIGTRRYGVQFGTGFGLQIGRIRSAGN